MSNHSPLILIIEDEPQIRRFLRAALTANQYDLIETTRAKDGLAQAATRLPDLIILDLGLPDMDGLEVISQLRQWATMPIIVLSAREREQDKINALDNGADDYLTKPFGVGELLARIRVALRHVQSQTNQENRATFQIGDLRVDLAQRQVFVAGQPVHLTPIEYKLLAMLVQNAGKVVTQSQLLREVWGPAYLTESHYLRVYMGQLRQKLEADSARPRYLLTEPGVGYRLRTE